MAFRWSQPDILGWLKGKEGRGDRQPQLLKAQTHWDHPRYPKRLLFPGSPHTSHHRVHFRVS